MTADMSHFTEMRAAAGNLAQDSGHLFQQAINKFQETFTAEEQAQMPSFKNCEQLIAHMKGLVEPSVKLAKVPSSVDAFCKAITALAKCLDPYLVCTSSFVSTIPDISGLLWGTIRFLFKLCRNYTSFLDKLAEMIYKVTEEVQLKDRLASLAIENARQFSESDSGNTSSLAAAIGTLFTDLLELFCLVCQLFPKKDAKRWQAALRVGKVFWVPFDEHFAHFQQKFSVHKEVLIVELERHSETSRMKAYINLKKLNEQTLQHLQPMQANLKQERLASLKVWLSPPSWTPAFEEAKNRRFRDTSEWILRHPQYQWWCRPFDETHRVQDSSEGLTHSPRILSIQAKPGYGKSILCSVTIQHQHQASRNKKLSGSNTNYAVGYYFFDKQRSMQSDHTGAIRAIITQLLHQHQDMPELIDLASIMRDHSGSGEPIASPEDLRDLLSIFLQKFEESSLILDGLDECGNLGHFLGELEDIVCFSKTKILFSSRPNVDFCGHFKDFQTLSLEDAANFKDIEAYLLPEIHNLIRRKMLIQDDSAEHTAHLMARKSRSMFLWASLLVNYLKCDMMTPQDRIDAINDMNLFPELDLLYDRILSNIFSWNTGKAARHNVQAIFDWLCVSARPLTAAELRSAIAARVGSETKKSRNITNFERTVVKMTGALVEIASDNTVRFIHTSVLEFFLGSADYAVPMLENGRPKIDPDTVCCSIAAVCLSYLVFDGPKKPLSLAFGSACTRKNIVFKYPLLLYSTQFWAFHAFQAVEKWTPLSHESNLGNISPKRSLVNTIIMFLSDKLAVTSWTEVAWTFGSEPCLGGLPFMTEKLAFHMGSGWGERMNRFCTDVTRLNSEWAHVLRENPGEIWEPSIPAFLKSPFWVETTDAQVTSLNDTACYPEATVGTMTTDPILVASQCSADGSKVGLIKLWPSSKFHREITAEVPDSFHLLSIVDELSQEWEITYEIKTVQNERIVYAIRLELPAEQIRHVLQTAFGTQEPKRFAFPVSFSAELSHIMVLGYLIRVLPGQMQQEARVPSQHNFAIQDLGIYRRLSPHDCPLREDHDTLLSVSQCPCSYSWYHITFSPNAKYLVVVRGPGRPAQRYLFAKMGFTVYKDTSDSLLRPRFVVVGQMLSNVSPDTRSFTFHPTLPVLAISQLAVTALWFFEEGGSNLRTIVAHPLQGLSFSRCGNYIHGDRQEHCGPIEFTVINITTELERFQSTAGSCPPIDSKPTIIKNPEQNGVISGVQQALDVLALGDAPGVLESGQIVFGMQENSRRVSMVRQYQRTGEVVLEGVSQDGTIVNECVTRLPVSASLDKSYATLLNVFNRGDNMQVILNKAAEDTYSIDTAHIGNELPLLITRTKESIPQCSRKRILLLEDQGTGRKRRLHY